MDTIGHGTDRHGEVRLHRGKGAHEQHRRTHRYACGTHTSACHHRHHTTHITIHTDSLYAMNMTTGTWMPRAKNRRNACLVRRMRILWRQVQRKAPGATNIAHVRSHTGVPGNEIADWMADQGQHSDDSISIPDASRWAVRWLDQRPPPRPSAPRTRDPAAARTPHAPQAMPRPPPPQRGASSPEFPAAAVT